MLRIAGVVIATAVSTSAAVAGDLRPIEAKSISLDTVSGVAYYTAESDGYSVVATVTAGEGTPPVRFMATLLPGQRAVVSVPREPGLGALTFEMVRIDDRVEVVEPEKMAQLIDSGWRPD